MTPEEQLAAINSSLAEALADLRGRPFSPALVTAYWLVMTNLLLKQYGVSEESVAGLFPLARELRVLAQPVKMTVN
jgi:hypothetical protein